MKYLHFAILLICLLAARNPLYAQDFWQPLAGPNVASVASISASADGATLYAATGYGLYRSTSQGLLWELIPPSQLGDADAVQQVACGSGQQVYASTTAGVYRSANGGATWTAATQAPVAGGTRQLVSNGGKLYAVTTTGKLLRSADAGDSWTTVYSHAGSQVYGFAGGGTDTLWLAAEDGVYHSYNNGTTWLPAASGLPAGAAVQLNYLSGQNLLLAIWPAGLGYSLDYGQNWTVAQNSGIGTETLTSLASWDSELLVGTLSGIVYQSADTGRTWTTAYIHPAAVAINCLAAVGADAVYAGSQGAGVLRAPATSSWILKNDGLVNANITALAAADTSTWFAATSADGVYFTQNGGASWSRRSTGLGTYRINCLAYQGNDTLYAGTQGAARLYRSYNSGQTWLPAESDLTASAAITALLCKGDTLLAGTLDGQLLASATGGRLWEVYQPTRAFQGAINGIATRGDTVYVASGGGLFRRLPGAFSWQQMNQTGSPAAVTTVVLANADTLYTAGTQGVHRWDGSLWTQLQTPVLGLATGVLAWVPQNGSLYFANGKDGVQQLLRGSSIWTAVNGGLRDRTVQRLLLVRGSSRLLAGSSISGVHQSRKVWSAPIVAVNNRAGELAATLYPNPVSAGGSIRLALSADGLPATAQLLGMTGRSAASWTITGDDVLTLPAGLAPGIYTLRVVAGSRMAAVQLVVQP